MEHLIIDCQTGQEVRRPLTEAEHANRRAVAEAEAARLAAEEAEQQARVELLAELKAHDDPLIRRLGEHLERRG